MLENRSIVSAIILAAGEGKRVGGEPKQFLNLCGKPLLAHSLETFRDCEGIGEIIITAPAEHIGQAQEVAEKFGGGKTKVITGGKTRFESARLGFENAGGGVVVFHDAARPFVSTHSILAVISGANDSGAASAGVALDDTIKKTRGDEKNGAERYFHKCIPRSGVWRAQTPQAFRKELLGEIYENFSGNPEEITDEASLFEGRGKEVLIAGGEKRNMKITTGEDLITAEAIIRGLERGGMKSFRVGTGFDAHRFGKNRKLFLGCVEIPFEKGLIGHSDADALAHAICDSLLGAAGLGDIGKHFPDSDPAYKNATGAHLLEQTRAIISRAGFQAVNVDCVIVCEKPRLSPHTGEMREKISAILGTDAVNIKATTTEKMGFTGRGEGVAAKAMCLIEKA